MILACLLEFIFVILTLYVPIVGRYYSRISNGSSKYDKFEETYYHSLNESGTAYTVVAWVVAAIILICLIVYLCNKRSILLNKILRFVILAMTPILPIMFFVALGQAKTFEMTEHGAGFVTGEGYRCTTNFWGVLFVIAFVVLSGYIVFQCITNPDPKFAPLYGAISNAKNRENEKSSAKSEEDLLSEECSDPRVAESNIRKVIRMKRESAQKKLDELQYLIKSLRDDTRKMQDKLIARHDDDFDKLNKIYTDFDPNTTDSKTLFTSAEYLALKSKCIEKKLPQISRYCDNVKKICQAEADVRLLTAILQDWADVEALKEHDTWSLPIQKTLYDKLYAIVNSPEYIAFQEKKAQWDEYYKDSILLRSDKETTLYHIKRTGDKVAVWESRDYNGKILSVDDIMFIKITETTTEIPTYNTTIPKKPSKFGIAMNEMIWGTAAATASAMSSQSNQSNAPKTKTEREAKIFFKYELEIEPLRTFSESTIDKLVAMFPEKIK